MNRYGGEYGGTGNDAGFGGGSQAYGGRSGFGSGGGAYDNDFNPRQGGYGYGGSSSGSFGGQGQGGYGNDTGFSGGGYGTEGDFGRGRDNRGGGGYGYGGSSGGYGGQNPGGQSYGGGAGYTGGGYGGGGQNYGGYGGWTGGLSDRDTERSYGGSSFVGGDELRRMRAADVMTDNPECVTPDTSLADAARKMRDLDVGIIPVVESESSKRLRGVLTDRDIAIRAVAEGKDATTTRVMEVMTTEVETCNKNDSLRDVLSVMEREQVRRVPITDREGRLVGIIAQADVATEVDSPQGQRRFADTVEQISEPGNPRGRGGWNVGGRGSQSRGGQGGGVMGAVRSAVSTLAGGASRAGGSTAPGSFRGRPDTGMPASGSQGTQGNSDPRAMNDPGSENV
jgi:CBS domain-containing protein